MKYNLSNIMKKAHGLKANYNMDMSTALIKRYQKEVTFTIC